MTPKKADKSRFTRGYWSVPPIWEGEAAFIIGGGPSLSQQNLDLIKDRRIIGVNCAYKLGYWVDIVFFADQMWWYYEEYYLREWPGLIVSCCNRKDFFPHPKVKRLGRKGNGWSDKPDQVAFNSNAGFAAINFAYHLGADPIILLGFDMKSSNRQHHWHENYPHPTTDKQHKEHATHSKLIAHLAKQNGLTVINTSPETAIPETDFPRMTLEEVVEKYG